MTAPKLSDQKPPITLDLGDDETITFVHVPAGEFVFQPEVFVFQPKDFVFPPEDEDLKKTYNISEFYLQQTPMTQGQYVALMGHNPSENKGRSLPVTNLSWLDIHTKLSRLDVDRHHLFQMIQQQLKRQHNQDWTCRLPNEVEWEYAASFGNTRFAGSDHPMPVAWFDQNSKVRAMPVASRLSNPLGLYDLSGNVWEWCHNRNKGQLNHTKPHKPLPQDSDAMALRGGGFWNRRFHAHVRFRNDYHAGNRHPGFGLRLCLVPHS